METNNAPMNSAVAAALRAEVAALGLSQAELEHRSGIPVVSLQRYLGGKRPITIDTLDAMARALEMTAVQVIEEAERRRRPAREADAAATAAPPPAATDSARTGPHRERPAPGDTRQAPSRQAHAPSRSHDRDAGGTRSHGSR